MYHVTSVYTHCCSTTDSSVGPIPSASTATQYVADCKLYHLHSPRAWEWCHNAEPSHSIKRQCNRTASSSLGRVFTGLRQEAWRIDQVVRYTTLWIINHVLHVIHLAARIKMPACKVNLILSSKCRDPSKQSVRPPCRCVCVCTCVHGCVMKIKQKEASGLTGLSGYETQYSDSVSSVKIFHGIFFQGSLLHFWKRGKVKLLSESGQASQRACEHCFRVRVCVCVLQLHHHSQSTISNDVINTWAVCQATVCVLITESSVYEIIVKFSAKTFKVLRSFLVRRSYSFPHAASRTLPILH